MIKLSRPCNGRKFAEAAGFEPASRFYTANCFRGSLLQPLGHASCLFPLRILKPPDPLFKGAISATCTPSAQCQRFVVLRAASDDAWGKWRTRRLSVFAIFIVCRCKYPASPRRLMTPGECGANLLNVSGINNKKIDYPQFVQSALIVHCPNCHLDQAKRVERSLDYARDDNMLIYYCCMNCGYSIIHTIIISSIRFRSYFVQNIARAKAVPEA